jgi:predicted RNase H-like HicB family nuclease
MKTLFVTIKKNDDGYTLFTENEIFSGIGDTLEEARANMEEQIGLYVDVMKADGKAYPAYLDGDYQISYQFGNVEALLNFYDGRITLAALSNMTGISEAQLSNYKNGRNRPRQNKARIIVNAFHFLGRELSAVSI